MAEFFGVSGGALVSSVDNDSAGDRAGLKAGDVITAVNGHAVQQPSDVAEEIRDARSGSQMMLKIVRNKKEMTFDVTLPTAQNPPGASGGDSVRLHV